MSTLYNGFRHTKHYSTIFEVSLLALYHFPLKCTKLIGHLYSLYYINNCIDREDNEMREIQVGFHLIILCRYSSHEFVSLNALAPLTLFGKARVTCIQLVNLF